MSDIIIIIIKLKLLYGYIWYIMFAYIWLFTNVT